MLLLGSPQATQAQALTFGSADDPREQLQRVWWKRESSVELRTGLSLIGAQWRAVAGVNSNLVTKSFTGRLNGSLRAGVFGNYDPDIDEPYDALRVLEFIRYEPPRNVPLHLRAGPINRMRLGNGHVVNFFSSAVAWEERTIGVETMLESSIISIGGFTDNILLDGVTGGRLTYRPLFWIDNALTRTAELGFSYVTDLANRIPGAERLEAFNIDAQFNAFGSGSIRFIPFASFAWYTGYGSGIGFGASLESEDFIDLLRFQLRMALYYNGEQFIPGYINTFYTINNASARILDSDAPIVPGEPEKLVGVTLANAVGGNDLHTELRLLIFERFEFWYVFRRHYGTQRLSENHFRLYFRAVDQLRLEVGIDRSGLTGFFSLFGDLDDQSALVFGLDYRIFGNLWFSADARYSYERITAQPDGTEVYLVQRRFEPMTGLRIRF